MATKTITGLVLANQVDIDDTTVFPVDNKFSVTRKITMAMLRTALGNLAFTGNVTGSGAFGSIALTIAAKAVTLARMADLAQGVLIGRWSSGAGTPETLTIGAGLSYTGGILTASAAASAAPSATLHTQRHFGGY